MVDQGLQGWGRHLAGGRTPGDEYVEQMQQVCIAASGHPIVIHADISFDELAKRYAQSAIYWRASGYGEDEVEGPNEFAYLGITTAEAMASGCVPIVSGKGGQPEIVTPGANGYLWQNPAELKILMLRLIEDLSLREKISAAAPSDSRLVKPTSAPDWISSCSK